MAGPGAFTPGLFHGTASLHWNFLDCLRAVPQLSSPTHSNKASILPPAMLSCTCGLYVDPLLKGGGFTAVLRYMAKKGWFF